MLRLNYLLLLPLLGGEKEGGWLLSQRTHYSLARKSYRLTLWFKQSSHATQPWHR